MSNCIGNKVFNETKINYLQSQADTTFISKASNASIVLGNDKPGGRFSGHGGVGDNSCATVDIVAGRASSITQDKQDVNTYYSDNNFILDAARIYISQMTDIDDNFSIVDGKIGNSKNKSSIGMKADNIRIIARSGIKLVTKTDSTNSAGEEIVSNCGVDIIALNDDSNLQPMVLGNNLVDCLNELIVEVDKLQNRIANFMDAQQKFNTSVSSHVHYSPFFAQPTLPSPTLMVENIENTIGKFFLVDLPYYFQKVNFAGIASKYLKNGINSIISKYNNVN